MATLMLNLKERTVKNNYQFIASTFSACIFFPGFNLLSGKTQKINDYCNDTYFEKLKQILSNEKNSIIIFGGRMPLYESNYLFNNQEGGVEGQKWKDGYISLGKYDTVLSSFKNEVLKLSNNHKIILIYPIPEVGWNPNEKIFNQWLNRKNKFSNKSEIINITTSYEVYKNRTKPSFELLDSMKSDNIYRVYPHQFVCDTTIKNRCITHDDKYMFYSDDDHPSLKGAELINDLIMKEIEKIKLKSN